MSRPSLALFLVYTLVSLILIANELLKLNLDFKTKGTIIIILFAFSYVLFHLTLRYERVIESQKYENKFRKKHIKDYGVFREKPDTTNTTNAKMLAYELEETEKATLDYDKNLQLTSKDVKDVKEGQEEELW